MDSSGAAVALAKLIWNCYMLCSQASGSFGHLQNDLHSFHTALSAAAPSLTSGGIDLSALRNGCEEVVSDITEALNKHESLGTTKQKIFDKLSWYTTDVNQLRSRLTVQVSLLNLYISAVNSRHSPILQDHGESPRSSQSADSAGASEKLIEDVKALALQTTRPTSTGTPSPSTSTVPLINTDHGKYPFFNESRTTLPSSASSAASSGMEYRSLSSKLKAKLQRSRSGFISAAEGGDIVTLLKIAGDPGQKSQLDQRSIDKALIAVASNEKCEREQARVIGHLVDWGAELECRDKRYGRTPLIWAVTVGRRDLVDVLLDKQAHIETRDTVADWTPLMWAVFWGNEAIIERLLDQGANPKATDGICERTPLLWASKTGAHGAAKVLLQRDPNNELLEVKDKDQLSPLALAYVEGHEPLVKTLLAHDANPNFQFPSGMPLLILAITAGEAPFVQLLLNSGASIHSKNDEGIPALSVAVRQEHPGIAKFLIAQGAPLEARDNQGRTALMWAIGRAREDLVELLVRSGADRLASDGEGRSVRKWAELTEDKRIVDLVVRGKG